jgi:hypothetical protein
VTIDQITSLFDLKRIRRLDNHPNCHEYKEYSYVSGYAGIFGREIYSTIKVYQEVIEWTTNDGSSYGVAIEPVVVYKNGYPTVDYYETEKILIEFIKETINSSVAQRLQTLTYPCKEGNKHVL